LIQDSSGDKIPVSEYTKHEMRFQMVEKIDPRGFRLYGKESQADARRRMAVYRYLAQEQLPTEDV
ncbi:MAG: hypothetical protein GWP07_05860, partial [Xanthomonadaceae bacterium]|nr:hypothetical protein [Xanthomonadaceae bacterium]